MRPWLLVLALAALSVSGCRFSDSPPDLLNVLDVAATTIDVGDQVEVIGTGFPEGRVGTVTFSGRLHRPGLPPESVFLTVRAASASRNRVALDFTERLQQELCGAGKEPRHTTFRGELVVAFSPRQAGAPPITGRLGDVVLDLTPPEVEPDVRAERLDEGRRAAEFIGLVFDDDSASQVVVASVLEGSRAERAGLLAQDQVLSFNGVLVHDPSDLAPAAGQRVASVSVRRGRLQEPIARVVEVDGFVPTAPRELAFGAMLVGFAVGVMLLFVAPIARLITWAERRTAYRLLDAVGTRSRIPRTWLGWIGRGVGSVVAERLLPVERGHLLLRTVPYLQFLAVSAAFTLVAFGFPLVAEDLDLPLAMLASTTALVAIGLVLGGWRGARRWSLLAGLKSALLLLLFQLPAVGVFSVVVLTTGSSRAVDLVASQGGLPWQWLVFSNPLLLVGLSVLLAAAVPELSRASLELPEVDQRDGHAIAIPNPASRCLMFFAEWGHVFVVAGLAAVLLLGGWNVPGVDLARQGHDSRWQMVGAGLLQLKCWGVVLLVRGTRWLLPRLSLEQTSGLYWRWLMPLTLVVVGLTLGWSWGQADEFVRSLQQRLSMVLFAVTLFVAGYLAVRVLANLSHRSAQLNVNPWL